MMTRLWLSSFCIYLLLGNLISARADDVDTDRDGLSDFQEIHKYFTDPKKGDSDNDGTDDADWHERREYTYTIRTVVYVLRPCNTEVVNDDYQDAKILAETKNYIQLEVVHYPLNTCAEGIQGQKSWRAA